MVVKGDEPISHACVLLFKEKKIFGGVSYLHPYLAVLCHTRYQSTKIWSETRVYLAFSSTLGSVDVIHVFSAYSRPEFFLKVTFIFSEF